MREHLQALLELRLWWWLAGMGVQQQLLPSVPCVQRAMSARLAVGVSQKDAASTVKGFCTSVAQG